MTTLDSQLSLLASQAEERIQEKERKRESARALFAAAFKQESRAVCEESFFMQATFFRGAFLKSKATARWGTQFVANTRRVQNVQQQRQQRRKATAMKDETELK